MAIFIANVLFAQTPLGEIKLSNSINNIQVLGQGDSIFVSFEEKIPESRVQRGLWFYKGQASNILFDDLVEIDLIEVMKFSSEMHYYFLYDHNDTLELRSHMFNSKQKKRELAKRGIEVKGNLLATKKDSCLHLFFYDKENKILNFYDVRRSELINQRQVSVPDSLAIHMKNPDNIEFFEAGRFINTAGGQTKVKIVRTDSTMTLSQDDYKRNRTQILRIRLDNLKKSTLTIEHRPSPIWSSFVSGNYLYHFSLSGPLIELRITDINNSSEILTKGYLYGKFDEGTNYVRGPLIVGHQERFRPDVPLIGNKDLSVILSGEPESPTLRLGVYFVPNGAGVFAGSTPLMALVNMAVTTTINRLKDRPGINRYFYAKTNKDMSSVSPPITSQFTSPNQKADEYEVGLLSSKVRFKGYVRTYRNLSPWEGKDTLLRALLSD